MVAGAENQGLAEGPTVPNRIGGIVGRKGRGDDQIRRELLRSLDVQRLPGTEGVGSEQVAPGEIDTTGHTTKEVENPRAEGREGESLHLHSVQVLEGGGDPPFVPDEEGARGEGLGGDNLHPVPPAGQLHRHPGSQQLRPPSCGRVEMGHEENLHHRQRGSREPIPRRW